MKKYCLLAAAMFMALSLTACKELSAETLAVGSDAVGAQAESKITIEIQNETESGVQQESEAVTEPTAEASSETTVSEGGSTVTGATAAGTTAATTPTTTTEAATTEAKVYDVTSVNKTMYAIKPVNVRKSYSTESERISSLKAGQEVSVTGEAANGWIRIQFDGQEAYVYKTYLSTSRDDVEVDVPKQTQTTKPAATKPAATKPAVPQPTAPGSTPSPQPAPAPIPETIAPFPAG
ncbi:MAG: SH3 domain-containing protein [Hungatella sp.]